MPQVDVVTFFPQVSWFFILFVSTYVIFLRDALTSLFSISKTRIAYYLQQVQKIKIVQMFSFDKNIENFYINNSLINTVLLSNYNTVNNQNIEWVTKKQIELIKDVKLLTELQISKNEQNIGEHLL